MTAAIQTVQHGPVINGNTTAKCDSCKTENCEFNRNLPEICKEYTTEIESETSTENNTTKVRFHCKVNGLTSQWFDLHSNKPLRKYEDTEEYQAALALHCRGKDIFFRATNLNHTLNVGDKEALDLNTLSKNPDIEQFLLKEIHRTVSYHDDHVIKADFYTGISAYFSPLNFALKCESGSGKTYSTVQTLKFLPPEDVQMIGSQSPKVLTHENGILKDINGEPIEDPPRKPRRDEYEEKDQYNDAMDKYYNEKKLYDNRLIGSYYEVVLSNKVFVFLESINVETFMMIKSTLSHDNEQIDHKYVDDRGGVHVTRLIGYPACIFNSLDNEFLSEFATRTLTAAPTTTTAKITASMGISNKKASYPFLYKKESYNKRLIQTYLRQVKNIINQYNIKPLNPFPTLHDQFRSIETRDMRDFNHFLELVPAFTLFKLFQRPILKINDEYYLLSTIQDVIDAKKLFDSVSLTTKTSTDKRTLEFYYTVVRQQQGGATLNTLTDIYNKNNSKAKRRKISADTIRKWLKRLIEIEWVDVREGLQEDRQLTYFPLQAVNENEAQTQLYSEVQPQTSCNIEMQQGLSVFCEKDFTEWLETITAKFPPEEQILLDFNGSSKPITWEQIEDIVKAVNLSVTTTQNNIESGFKTEIKTESNCISEMQPKKKHPNINKIGMLKPSEVEHNQTCPECGFKNQVLTYEATRKDDSVLKVCERCGDEIITESQGEVF
jgi:hypothetical protein